MQWGGKPYKDLVAGLDFVKRVYADLIDTDRMVMLGEADVCHMGKPDLLADRVDW